MKKLILLPFLVFGQFLVNAQKPAKKAQQVITMNLLVAGSVHLPKTNNGKALGKDKDKNQPLQAQLELTPDKNTLVDKQVVETVTNDKNNPTKSSTVVYTITSM